MSHARGSAVGSLRPLPAHGIKVKDLTGSLLGIWGSLITRVDEVDFGLINLASGSGFSRGVTLEGLRTFAAEAFR
jgi:hypothetical protein